MSHSVSKTAASSAFVPIALYLDSPDSMDESQRKRFRASNSESCSGSSEEESICSDQDELTASVYESGDDSEEDAPPRNFASDNRVFDTEYEIASDSCRSYSSCTVSSASEVEDVKSPEMKIAELPSEDYEADVEYSILASTSCLSQVPPKVWNCLKCNDEVSFPMRFCSSCYQRRMERFMPRPRHKKKTNAALSSVAELMDELRLRPGENPCTSCGLRGRDGAFVHGKLIHAIFCYPCSKKAYAKRKDCPVCRRTIQSVSQIYF